MVAAKVGERIAWVATGTAALLLGVQVGLAWGTASDPKECASVAPCLSALQNLAVMAPYPAVVAGAFGVFLLGALGLRQLARRSQGEGPADLGS